MQMTKNQEMRMNDRLSKVRVGKKRKKKKARKK